MVPTAAVQKMNAAWTIIPIMILATSVSIPGATASFQPNRNYPNPTACSENCDEWHIVIAILLSTEANALHFNDVKKFIQNNVKKCLKGNEGRMAINIIDPYAVHMGQWCETYECVEKALEDITFESSAIAVEQFSKDDTQTVMAAKTGRALLKPAIMSDDRVPELLIISDYISVPFARQYDGSLSLKTNLSQVHFRLAIVGAPIKYYQDNSSLSNADIQFYDSFALLAEQNGRFCGPVSEVAWSTVFSVVVLIVIISIIVLFIIVICLLKIRFKEYEPVHRTER